jgi:CyaY protein
MSAMDEPVFRKLADAELKVIAQALDPIEALTVDLANDILTIEFEDGQKYVANLQGPTRQIWFAANFTAGHYDFDQSSRTWRDSKNGEELRVRIARDVQQKLGKPVRI